MALSQTQKIRALNLAFYKNPHMHGRLLFSRYVADRGGLFGMKCINALAAYDGWNEDNDSHGEADMCTLTVEGEKVWAKMDYYDKDDQNYGSENPADPTKTLRVCTILFPDEW
jgi:hypothetical protein